MSDDEIFLMRFDGGPFHGQTHQAAGPWPLTEKLSPSPAMMFTLLWSESGHYRKVRESQIPTRVEGLVRGAEYTWQPD